VVGLDGDAAFLPLATDDETELEVRAVSARRFRGPAPGMGPAPHRGRARRVMPAVPYQGCVKDSPCPAVQPVCRDSWRYRLVEADWSTPER
jgi:hypothetical protein